MEFLPRTKKKRRKSKTSKFYRCRAESAELDLDKVSLPDLSRIKNHIFIVPQ